MRRGCVCFVLLSPIATSFAAGDWRQVGSDSQGVWHIDTTSIRTDDDLVKVTTKVHLPIAKDLPLRGKNGEVTRTIFGVSQIAQINAIDCSKRSTTTTAYSFFNAAGEMIHNATRTREQAVQAMKEPAPGTVLANVVEAACTPKGKRGETPRVQGAAEGTNKTTSRESSWTASKPAAPDRAKGSGRYSGTGVVVNQQGFVLTNHHVVAACKKISIFGSDKRERLAERLGSDRKNDLALLRTDPTGLGGGVSIRSGAPLRSGETVMAIGFPLSGILSTEPNVSFGYVSATAGIGDDSSVFQLSAPVHKGNSGGPVLDQSGLMVGVVTSKLNAAATASATGDLPQNIAFGVKSEVVQLFLGSQNTSFNTVNLSSVAKAAKLDNPELAGRGKSVVVQVLCDQ